MAEQEDIRDLLIQGAERHRAGDILGAAEIYLQAQALDPRNGTVLGNLGVALRGLGHQEKALLVLEKAATFAPGDPETQYNFGNALRDAGRLEDAVTCFRRAIALRPTLPGPHVNLSLILGHLGRHEAAAQAARLGLLHRPDNGSLWMNLGVALSNMKHHEAAVACFYRAVAHRPDDPAIHLNLASAHFTLSQIESSAAAARAALSLQPDRPAAHALLGQALTSQGRLDEALSALNQALALEPDNLTAQLGRARALLLGGRWADGFPAYRARFRRVSFLTGPLSTPAWTGEEAPDQTLLLHAEQGLGDTLMGLRFVAAARARVGRVVIQVPPTLMGLAARVEGVDDVVSLSDPVPAHDIQAPMLDLLRCLAIDPETVPAAMPYLSVPEDLETPARPAGDERLYVGLIWAGDPRHDNDVNRSCGLEPLMPLLALPGIRFLSLQVGEPRQQLVEKGALGLVEDIAPALTDFSQTARFLMGLDLLISVDTGPVHLAGALNRPCWVLLPHAPDWRWMLDRTDSPWYPSLTLYRQPTVGDWQTVVERVKDDLRNQTGC
ncbi:tetratricopeptide repeat protein [Magnetospira sp. QH-2]|uniref:tetratricopeptide repeat-containing glycosyltransferase family protein n=1 Tax=Magnetospira sp. (strain QH-2) TaxID=1288970 RepID=UPI00130EC6D2|nr:tetratricopeptide repeat-containing glycosyltransferase family protein [Magnetospira sp. QH-2]